MSLSIKLNKRLKGFDLDVSLDLAEELLVLFGPSGAGKTQILKMISGIVRPDGGSVRVGDALVFDKASGVDLPMRERRIGYVFQDYALFPHMTVVENIGYGISGAPAKVVAEITGELVEVMRLSGLEKRYPHELSGGQKQRTALARTLATSPRLLLLDEPFSALDYQVREKLRSDLANIHEMYPVTTILVTHDLEEAFMLGGRIAVINDGRIEQVGTREDVFYRPATRNVARFLGARNIFNATIRAVSGDEVVLDVAGLGVIKASPDPQTPLSAGQKVSICIRPEEILIVRPDKVLDNRVQDNTLEGEITSTTGRGTTHILFVKAGTSALVKVEIPNFVLRKLALVTGKRIRVLLKKENIWIIP